MSSHWLPGGCAVRDRPAFRKQPIRGGADTCGQFQRRPALASHDTRGRLVPVSDAHLGDAAVPAGALPSLVWCADAPSSLLAVGDSLIWVTRKDPYFLGTARVWRCRARDLGRVQPQLLVELDEFSAPGQLAVAGQHLYATCGAGVARVPLSGGPVTLLGCDRVDRAACGVVAALGRVWLVTRDDRHDDHVCDWLEDVADDRLLPVGHIRAERSDDFNAIYWNRWAPRWFGPPAGTFFLSDELACVAEGSAPLTVPADVSVSRARVAGARLFLLDTSGRVLTPQEDPSRWWVWRPRTEGEPRLLGGTETHVAVAVSVTETASDCLYAYPADGGQARLLFAVRDRVTSAVACDGRLFWTLASGSIGATPLDPDARPVAVAGRAVAPRPVVGGARGGDEHVAVLADPDEDARARLRDALAIASDDGAAAPGPHGIAPWLGWTLLALGRYRRLQQELAAKLPRMLPQGLSRVPQLHSATVSSYHDQIHVSWPGTRFHDLRLRGHAGLDLDRTTVDPEWFAPDAFASWIERRASAIEERVWRWLPAIDVIAHLVARWVGQHQGAVEFWWARLAPDLEEVLAKGTLLDTPVSVEALRRLATVFGDVEVLDPASPRCSRVADQHAALIDALVDQGEAAVLAALPALRRGEALRAACDRLIAASAFPSASLLERVLKITADLDVLPAMFAHLVLETPPRRWPQPAVAVAARALVDRGQFVDAVRQWLARLVGLNVVGLAPAPAGGAAPSRELFYLALLATPGLAPVLLTAMLTSDSKLTVEDAVDLALAIDADWSQALLRHARPFASHANVIDVGLEHLGEGAIAPRPWAVTQRRQELEPLRHQLAQLAGDDHSN